jgi:beta-glucosidase
LIDYKHFDDHNIGPLYEFSGVSYTQFNRAQPEPRCQIQARPPDTSRPVPRQGRGWKDLWNEVATVSIEVENVGKHAGSVVPQLYLTFPQDETPSGTPVKVLRGFAKSFLQPGSVESMTFSLKRRDVSFWDVNVQEWIIPEGIFTFSVGFSSRYLRVELGSCVL